MGVEKLRKPETDNTIAVCSLLITVLIKSVQEKFDNVFRTTNYQSAMAFHQHSRLSSLSDIDDQFFPITPLTAKKLQGKHDWHGLMFIQ